VRAFEHEGMRLVLSDTVGFIRHLPHQLVDAFRSTLDETRDADLLLHVADAGEPESRRERQAWAVEDVLEEIGAGGGPRLLVLNRVARRDGEGAGRLRTRPRAAIPPSALPGGGLDEPRPRLALTARARLEPLEVLVPYARGEVISAIYSA